MPLVGGQTSLGFVISLLDSKGKTVFVFGVDKASEVMLPKTVQVKSIVVKEK